MTQSPAAIAVRLGGNIRALRSLRGWTLKHVAEQLGLSVSMLSEMERGVRNTSVESLVALAGLFECSTDDLLNSDWIPCPDCHTCLTCHGKRYIKASEVK